jgi:hypothetical protein
VTPRTTTAVRLEGKDCQQSLSLTERKLDETRMKGAFTDETLAALVASGKTGLVYAWSPHMQLSLDGVREARKAARQLGAELSLVLDPTADQAQAEAAARKAGLPAEALKPMQSLELQYRGVPGHYPALVAYGKGRILGWASPGYQPAERYTRQVRQRLTR